MRGLGTPSMALTYRATEPETGGSGEGEGQGARRQEISRAGVQGRGSRKAGWDFSAQTRNTSLSQEPVAKVSVVCRLPGGTGRQRVLLIF